MIIDNILARERATRRVAERLLALGVHDIPTSLFLRIRRLAEVCERQQLLNKKWNAERLRHMASVIALDRVLDRPETVSRDAERRAGLSVRAAGQLGRLNEALTVITERASRRVVSEDRREAA